MKIDEYIVDRGYQWSVMGDAVVKNAMYILNVKIKHV